MPRELHESNPMLGHPRLPPGIAYPEIYEMQARAIFEAAVEVAKETGKPVMPEIMIPLVATKAELDLLKEHGRRAWPRRYGEEAGSKSKYQIGTMIELPRAALTAGEIAETAEFFSFGTNDLTQTTFGMSPRRCRQASSDLYEQRASCPRIRSSRSIAKASAN